MAMPDSPTWLGTYAEIVADLMFTFDLNPDDPNGKRIWEDEIDQYAFCSILEYKLEIQWRAEHPHLANAPYYINKVIVFFATRKRQQLVWKTKLEIDSMFMPPSDQPSPAQIRQAEDEAAANVRKFAMLCIALYFSPHVVDYVRKLF